MCRARSRKSSVKRKPSKKKKKRNDDSDSDAFKRQRKPKVKYGRIGSDNEDLGIRTRGKKINYLDVLGSDSDEVGSTVNFFVLLFLNFFYFRMCLEDLLQGL